MAHASELTHILYQAATHLLEDVNLFVAVISDRFVPSGEAHISNLTFAEVHEP
jgi:hypothetical protein